MVQIWGEPVGALTHIDQRETSGRHFTAIFNDSNGEQRQCTGTLMFLLFSLSDDHSRVHLSSLEGVPDSDFINASFINVSISSLFCLEPQVLLV